MSRMTGIPVANSEVMSTYEQVKQAMPVSTNVNGFISSQQMGITQLAIKYCSVLVDDPIAAGIVLPRLPLRHQSYHRVR